MRSFFLLIIIVTFLSGCGPKGPSVTDCTPRVKDEKFICFNESNGKQIIALPASVDNWIFVSAADQRSIQTACQRGNGWPKIKVCAFSAREMKYVCFDEITGKVSTVQFSSSDKFGFIGVSSVDEQILLEFCAERAKKKNP